MNNRNIDQLAIVEKDIVRARIRLAYAVENLGIRKALQFQRQLNFLLQIRQILGGNNE
jgi:hypothetical protein